MTAREPTATGTTTSDDLWRGYEQAQKHYEADLQLFSNRMNLFFGVHAALLTVTVAAVGTHGTTGNALPQHDRYPLAIIGLLLSVIWFLVAASSYAWILEWRRQLLLLADKLRAATSVELAIMAFEKPGADHTLGRVILKVRPTMWSCVLPLVFVGAWIYVGWLA